MAKKIILSFTDQPLVGVGFSYDIKINGYSITYANGESPLSIEYRALNNESPSFIELKSNLSDTIDNTLNFLIANYVYSNVIYRRVNDTIEITVNTDDIILINFGTINDNITATFETVNLDDQLNLRYFFQYTNVVNDTFLCQIYKKNNLLPAIEISGKASLDKGSVKDHLDTIRGTGLSLELEATNLLTLEDLYSENEQDFTVKFYKNGNLIFYGFLKPDGVYQSFTRDMWIITIDCIDGLGALSNLSFVQSNGLHFLGKMKAIDIVYCCLQRSGISLPINTAINVYYEGLTLTDSLDILQKVKMNADRFVKIDNDTIMSCEEVLKSILDVFCAVITQENGEWYIFKPNELYSSDYVIFKKYDINNNYTGNVNINFSKELGSQIDNYYPHHCSGNQKIQIKGGVSAFRLGYKYGFIKGLLENEYLIHDTNLVFENWTLQPSLPSGLIINDPLDLNGLKTKTQIATNDRIKILVSEPITLSLGNPFDFKVELTTQSRRTRFNFKIKIGSYFLKDDGTWTTSDTMLTKNLISYNSITWTISALGVPVDGVLTVEIYDSFRFKTAPPQSVAPTICEINKIEIINTIDQEGYVGEFHTVSRATKISSIVKENRTVYNGDNAGIVYLGAIFKEDGLTPTELWYRKDKFESFPLLRIAAEEELRISQKPLKIFSGSVFGYIPYLSIININNINAKFSPIEYSYDSKANITTLKLLELFSAEISDIIYKFTFDYGNTVKPTITS